MTPPNVSELTRVVDDLKSSMNARFDKLEENLVAKAVYDVEKKGLLSRIEALESTKTWGARLMGLTLIGVIADITKTFVLGGRVH